MKFLQNKKIFFPILAFIMVLSTILNTPTTVRAQSNGISEKEIEIIQASLKYDVQNKKYVFDKNKAIKNGLTENQANNLKVFFESMNDEQRKDFNKNIGFEPDFNKNQSDLRVPPALIAVLSFVGGAAAGKILDEVMNYGIAKACESNKGKWAAFDDYCETNGHV